MKRLYKVALAVTTILVFNSCNKGIDWFPETCKVTQIVTPGYYTNSYDYDTRTGLVNKVIKDMAQWETTDEYSIKRNFAGRIVSAELFSKSFGEVIANAVFFYVKDELAKIEMFIFGNLATTYEMTYYPNGLLKTLYQNYGDPDININKEFIYNNDGVLTEYRKFDSNGFLYQRNVYKPRGAPSPSAWAYLMKKGLPQLDFDFFEFVPVRDPGINTTLEIQCPCDAEGNINYDKPNDFRTIYKWNLAGKTLNKDGYTTTLDWRDNEGNHIDPDSGGSFIYDCITKRNSK
ncbi:MAG TPA: hypothetical protein PLM81_01200 [Ginsengibacter sp.]|nr:hypothetical protein [Ginsengibacter sp.]HRP17519.1 hypothetical protein [Ginsengibacter sp.]HRP43622.1 hypothetical protein [Ginsengibacter sp.]